MSALRRVIGWPLRRYVKPRARTAVARLDAHIKQQTSFLDEGVSAILANQRLINQQLSEFEPEYQIPPLDRRALGNLRWPVAEFLNWAMDPSGYAGQAGLWSNGGVQIAHDVGSVKVLSINERIVEIPYCFHKLGGLPTGSRVLDVGGAESTLALSLASLGYSVTVVDPNGYALRHPGVAVVRQRLDQLDAGGPFDAAVALSSIEHFGLGSYDQPITESRGDLEAMGLLRKLVKPGGLLVLTVPLGDPSVDEFQRVYDIEGVRLLTDRWEVEELTAAWRRSPTEWTVGSPTERAGDRGVAMIVARNPVGPD